MIIKEEGINEAMEILNGKKRISDDQCEKKINLTCSATLTYDFVTLKTYN